MIIGVTGTNGAGKGTVVDYLVKQKGFARYSVREFLVEEIQRRGLPIDRPTMRLVGNDLRKMHGAGYITQQLLGRAVQDSANSLIESIRSVGEAEYLRSQGALLWAVDADRRIRYERTLKRMSETDKVSFEQFCEYENNEMTSTDPAQQNLAAVMSMADAVFTNNGTLEELYAQVEDALAKAGVQ